MNCPNCGDADAVLLLTSIQCSGQQCSNFDQEYATEVQMRKFKYDNWLGKQTGTRTGRISCKNPNYSNLPKLKKKTSVEDIIADIETVTHKIEKLNQEITEATQAVETISLRLDTLFKHQISVMDYLHFDKSAQRVDICASIFLPRMV